MEIYQDKYDLIIIGAGMAGCSTAYHLVKGHYHGSILILEASSRIGGRIGHTYFPLTGSGAKTTGQQSASATGQDQNLKPIKIELGANWIHGLEGNPIYYLARRLNAVPNNSRPTPCATALPGDTADQEDEDTVDGYKVLGVTETGRRIPTTVVREVYEEYFKILKECDAIFDEYKGSKSSPTRSGPDLKMSVGDRMRQAIDQYLANGVRSGLWKSTSDLDSDGPELRQSIFNQLLARETCISGCDRMSEVSLSQYGSYDEFEGGNLTIPGGYVTLCQALVDEAKAGHRDNTFHIAFDSEVVAIDLVQDQDQDQDTDNGQEIEDNLQYEVTITTADGSRYRGHQIVVTLPLGVLKDSINGIAGSPTFRPPLPTYKSDAIRRLGFGVVDKIFLHFAGDMKWWPTDVNELLVFWNSNSGPDGPEKSEMSSEVEVNETNWFKKIYSFTHLGENVLIAWISGREAKFMEEQLSCQPAVVGRVMAKILRRLLSASDGEIPEPDKVLTTSWWSNRLSRGSYSFIPVGSTVDDTQHLERPIYGRRQQDLAENVGEDQKPVIMFAGEATHPCYYSTVHGAFLSGRRAAAHLVNVTH